MKKSKQIYRNLFHWIEKKRNHGIQGKVHEKIFVEKEHRRHFESMSNRTTINEQTDEYYPILIGDILLHSEQKCTPILVISQPLMNKSSQISHEKSTIHSVFKNPTGILCDLKNTTAVPIANERMVSLKKFTRFHQVSWNFVKRLKSKVMIIHNQQVKSKINRKQIQRTIF